MAVKKSDLVPATTTPPEKDRPTIIAEQRTRIERFLDACLRSGQRLFPFDVLPKVVPPLTNPEAWALTGDIRRAYEDAGWKIENDLITAEPGVRDKACSAWRFS